MTTRRAPTTKDEALFTPNGWGCQRLIHCSNKMKRLLLPGERIKLLLQKAEGTAGRFSSRPAWRYGTPLSKRRSAFCETHVTGSPPAIESHKEDRSGPDSERTIFCDNRAPTKKRGGTNPASSVRFELKVSLERNAQAKLNPPATLRAIRRNQLLADDTKRRRVL